VTDDADPSPLEGDDAPPQRTRFSFAQVELKWLPISESAFLLWVLAALFGLWLVVGYLLGLV
jgi:hypothetical protein